MELRKHNLYVQRWAWRRVDRLLSVSARLADRMAATVGVSPTEIRIIRNGVDTRRFASVDRDQARRALGLAPSDLAIGAVGRFQPVKDHANLLLASSALAREGHQHLVLLAGVGPLRKSLKDLALRLGIAERVRFLGHRPDVESVLAALDIFALPSKSEGLSNTLLEAMAAGVPVVATHVGGADELVQHGATGLLVPAQQPDALASALSQLIMDPEKRRHMGYLGQQRAHQEFSLERMIRSYEELYLSLA